MRSCIDTRETIMTTLAEVIKICSLNVSEATERAAKHAVSTDQNWEKEETLYTFKDGSILVCSGPTYEVRDITNTAD